MHGCVANCKLYISLYVGFARWKARHRRLNDDIMKKTLTILMWIFTAALVAGAAVSCDSDDDNTAEGEAMILSMRFDDDRVVTQPVVIEGDPRIKFMVAPGTEDLVFTPTIKLSEGATVTPASGASVDFSSPVIYTVTSPGGKSVIYKVTCVRVVGVETAIEEMIIDNAEGVVEGDVIYNGTNIDFFARTDVTEAELKALKLRFKLASETSTIAPEPADAGEPDFSKVRTFQYRVTAENPDIYTVYTVICNVVINDDARIMKFGVGDAAQYLESEPVITNKDDGNSLVAIRFKKTAPSGKITFSPEITLAPNATVSPASGEEIEMTYGTPVLYTVTAQDGVTQRVYEVTAGRELDTGADIIDITFEDDDTGLIEGMATVGENNDNIELYIREDATAEELAAAVFNVVGSPNATVTPDASNPETITIGATFRYTVTSEDGTASNTFSVTCWKRHYYDFEDWESVKSGSHNYWRTGKWHNANAGTVLTKVMGKYEFDDFPTIRSENSHSGSYAASLSTYYLPKGGGMYPYVVAGNMFLGWFNFTFADLKNPLKCTKFGTPVDYKPLRVRGYYKYKPGETFYNSGTVVDGAQDACALSAVFFETGADTTFYLDGTNVATSAAILASAQMTSGKNMTEYEQFELVLDYNNPNGLIYDPLKKYKLAVIFSSSKDGADFKGADRSELLVDDVEILFE